MGDELKLLLEKAKRVAMSPDQQEQQRRSFAFGNAGFENPLITREMVDEEAKAGESKS